MKFWILTRIGWHAPWLWKRLPRSTRHGWAHEWTKRTLGERFIWNAYEDMRMDRMMRAEYPEFMNKYDQAEQRPAARWEIDDYVMPLTRLDPRRIPGPIPKHHQKVIDELERLSKE